jgi:tRNA nucleotidyltransferase (CCA-adding enzyme)
MNFELYKVGGCVRDQLIGRSSTDIDYTVVISDKMPANLAFDELQQELTNQGYKIFTTIPERFTIRSKFPDSKLISDFVLSVGYDGMTSDLQNDLLRRDFTMNALAIDEFGSIIDISDGRDDIENKIIKCPIDPNRVFQDDSVRIFRAFRFCIQLGFEIDDSVWQAICKSNFANLRIDKLVDEMIKMFKINSGKSLELFWKLRECNLPLYEFVFENVWLRTNKIKVK